MEIKNGNITIGKTGRSVVDGPFADIQAKYYDVKDNPHCLSRGFRDDEGNLGHMNGDAISPASIEEVLQLDNYERGSLRRWKAVFTTRYHLVSEEISRPLR